jgi:hypothetical protein
VDGVYVPLGAFVALHLVAIDTEILSFWKKDNQLTYFG